jgi:hypothetical protein
MEKAYDLKDLAEKLKAHGLEASEALAKEAIEAVFEWLEESAKTSPNLYDDMLSMLYPQLKKLALSQADKISA